jgi:hypothetical protein
LVADTLAGLQMPIRWSDNAGARDPEGMFAAIAEKIEEQAKYIVMRDAGMAIIRAERSGGGPGRGKKGPAPMRLLLRKGDPDNDMAYRWRKAFCAKNGAGTEIDRERSQLVLALASHRIAEKLHKVKKAPGGKNSTEFASLRNRCLAGQRLALKKIRGRAAGQRTLREWKTGARQVAVLLASCPEIDAHCQRSFGFSRLINRSGRAP